MFIQIWSFHQIEITVIISPDLGMSGIKSQNNHRTSACPNRCPSRKKCTSVRTNQIGFKRGYNSANKVTPGTLSFFIWIALFHQSQASPAASWAPESPARARRHCSSRVLNPMAMEVHAWRGASQRSGRFVLKFCPKNIPGWKWFYWDKGFLDGFCTVFRLYIMAVASCTLKNQILSLSVVIHKVAFFQISRFLIGMGKQTHLSDQPKLRKSGTSGSN